MYDVYAGEANLNVRSEHRLFTLIQLLEEARVTRHTVLPEPLGFALEAGRGNGD